MMPTKRRRGDALWGLALLLSIACGGDAGSSNPATGPSAASSEAEARDKAKRTDPVWTDPVWTDPVSTDLVSTDPISIVLVSIDTLRSDHVGAYGGAVATPHLDSLAAGGIVFERAYSQVPLTLPSHLTMLTGLLPPSHGVRDNIGYRPQTAELPYLPSQLRDAGYATAAAVSAYVMQGRGGLAHGFDLYDDSFDGASAGRRSAAGIQRSGGATLEAVEPWLRARKGAAKPFFLFLHLFEPHTPYAAPEPFASRYGATSYAAEVAAADALVGRLLDLLRRLDLYDDTAILVLSDHGEGLGEHGEDEHGLLLYRESLQVPLILRLPGGRRAGVRVPQPVGLVDVAPTLRQLAALQQSAGEALDAESQDAGSEGRSLLPFLDPNRQIDARPVYAETYYPRLHFGWSELLAVIDGPLHYIEAPAALSDGSSAAELYDLQRDAQQIHNLLPSQRRQTVRLRQVLSDFASEAESPAAVSDGERRALASLGYVDGVAGPAPLGAEVGLPHPKDRLSSVDDLKSCLREYQHGNLKAAIPRCRAAVAAHPLSLDAWEHLGRALLENGASEEALPALQQAIELAPGRVSHLVLAAANLLLQQQRLDDALALLEGEIALAPEPFPLRLFATRTLVLAGRLDEALRQSEALVEKRPQDGDARYLRGAIRMGAGDLKAGEVDLRQALRLVPGHPAALSDLATLMEHQGRRDEAIALWRQLATVQPTNRAATTALQRLLADGGGAP